MCSDNLSTATKSRANSASISSASSTASRHREAVSVTVPSGRKQMRVSEDCSFSPREKKMKRQRPSMAGGRQLWSRRWQGENAYREITALVLLCVVTGVFLGTQIHNYAALDQHAEHADDATSAVRRFMGKSLKGAVSVATEDAAEELGWPHSFIHVVNTRFMQHQAHLHDLAAARLLLFEAFCLPTMIRQTAMDHTLRRTEHFTISGQNERAASARTATSAPPTFPSSENGVFDHPTFIWIVKIDPETSSDIRTAMIQLLAPYPNFFLVASNKNFGVGIVKGGWRGGEAGREILGNDVDIDAGSGRGWSAKPQAQAHGTILTGDVDLLRRAYRYRSQRIVLETRLDADDGLNIQYLEKVQEEATKRLSAEPLPSFSSEWEQSEAVDRARSDDAETGHRTKSPKRPDIQNAFDTTQKAKWTYWCSMNHIEWDPSPPLEDSMLRLSKNASSSEKFSSGAYGSFVPWRSPQDCITPGLTIGLSVGVGEHDYPRYTHINIGREIVLGNGGTCGVHPKQECLRMVDDPKIGAFRSRTPTSAGMRGVVTDGDKIPEVAKQIEEKAKDPKVFAAMWSVLRVHFSVTEEAIVYVSEYIRKNLVAIVADNLRGQCTHGHSCKLTSREELQRLLEVAGNGSVAKFGLSADRHEQKPRQLFKER